MTLRKALVIIIRSAFLGLVVATPLSGQELVSLEIWLGATAVFAALNLVIVLVQVAAVEPAHIAVAWDWRGRRRPVGDQRPWELRAVEGLIASAQNNPRAFRNRLRPRLTELASHFLPIYQGIDPARDQRRAHDLLGDVAWLIDPDISDRKPTVGELDQFFDIILAEGHANKASIDDFRDE